MAPVLVSFSVVQSPRITVNNVEDGGRMTDGPPPEFIIDKGITY